MGDARTAGAEVHNGPGWTAILEVLRDRCRISRFRRYRLDLTFSRSPGSGLPVVDSFNITTLPPTPDIRWLSRFRRRLVRFGRLDAITRLQFRKVRPMVLG